MRGPSQLVRSLLLVALFGLLPLEGCGGDPPSPASNFEADVTAQLPESDPPILTTALAERIRPGMSQDEVLSILRDAGRGNPRAASILDNAYTSGKASPERFDLTVAQGKSKLVLGFQSAMLVAKSFEASD